MTRLQLYIKYNPNWNNLRWQVLRRCHGKCEAVGCIKKAREVHHTHYRTLFREAPDDLMALCSDCHGRIHGKNKVPNGDQLFLPMFLPIRTHKPANDNIEQFENEELASSMNDNDDTWIGSFLKEAG